MKSTRTPVVKNTTTENPRLSEDEIFPPEVLAQASENEPNPFQDLPADATPSPNRGEASSAQDEIYAFEMTTPEPPVSYTHLTLPTIYSV